VNNWRASHAFPLNTMQVGLRERARQINPEALVAQRIKRRRSIELKLVRFPTMKLSQMQDLGGCRAILNSVNEVNSVVTLYDRSAIKHKRVDLDDYISTPKVSGYRGIHLIYRYYSDRATTYNGHKIEVQLRTTLQHAWATAVETVGTFTRQALKSSQGEQSWLRFFALMGTAIAIREDTPPVPDTPDREGPLIEELREFVEKLDVEARLSAYGTALQIHEERIVPKAVYYLLVLDTTITGLRGEPGVGVTAYEKHELEQAERDYAVIEEEIKSQPGKDAVLVSVESLASLQRAFPNYFLDTDIFRQLVRDALG
jgi:hypothetical protein